ncbi:MAG: hypothetical protein ACQKBU_02775, partial [Verrucomicrobiales bacterium]
MIPGTKSQEKLKALYEVLERRWFEIQGAPPQTRMQVLQTVEPTLFLISKHSPAVPGVGGGNVIIAYRSSEPIEIADEMWITRPIKLAGTYEYTSVSGAGKKVLLFERDDS